MSLRLSGNVEIEPGFVDGSDHERLTLLSYWTACLRRPRRGRSGDLVRAGGCGLAQGRCSKLERGVPM